MTCTQTLAPRTCPPVAPYAQALGQPGGAVVQPLKDTPVSRVPRNILTQSSTHIQSIPAPQCGFWQWARTGWSASDLGQAHGGSWGSRPQEGPSRGGRCKGQQPWAPQDTGCAPLPSASIHQDNPIKSFTVRTWRWQQHIITNISSFYMVIIYSIFLSVQHRQKIILCLISF